MGTGGRYCFSVFTLSLAWWALGNISVCAATFSVAPGGDDHNPGTAARPWATLQRAADVAGPGDVVVVQPGPYVGAKFHRSGTPTAPIFFHAEAGAVISTPGPLNTNRDNLWIRDADYITLEGFEVTGAPRAGIAIQGEPDAPATGNVIWNNFCHHNGRWGIFTGYAQDVVIQENETSFSAAEHGIYVSNSADNPVIKENVSHHNRACGIQLNADPRLPGDKIISHAVVEANIVYENGLGGGAAINLASIRNSIFRNNLLYANHAGGIAGWDDGAGKQWGTKSNRFLNNTIVMAADGRFALSLKNGSTSNVVENNILFHPGARGSIEIDRLSLSGFLSDYNLVVNRFSCRDVFISFAQWRAKGYDPHSRLETNVTKLFVNAPGGNYRLKSGSLAINAGRTVPQVTDDLDGRSRPQGPRYDIGAYEAPAS